MWFLTGTQAGCAQYVGELPKERLGRAYVFLHKSNKAMPYLNRPWKKDDLVLKLLGNQYMDPPEDAGSKQWVDTCTFPSRIEKDGRVIFQARPDRKDWRRLLNAVVKPDCVCFCTGYKQDFAWLHPSHPTLRALPQILETLSDTTDPTWPSLASFVLASERSLQ